MLKENINSVTNEKIDNIKNLTKLLKKDYATELNKELLDKSSLVVTMLNKSKIVRCFHHPLFLLLHIITMCQNCK